MLYGLKVILSSKRLILDYSLINRLPRLMDLEVEFEQVKMTEGIRRTNDVEALQIIAISLVESNFRIRELYKNAALAALPFVP